MNKSSAHEDQQVSLASSPTSSSSSLIRLDEVSSFGATKQSRLPALIKLTEQSKQPISMPSFSGAQVELSKQPMSDKQINSLPVGMNISSTGDHTETVKALEQLEQLEVDKENEEANLSSEYQVVDMDSADLLGPSLPQPTGIPAATQATTSSADTREAATTTLTGSNDNKQADLQATERRRSAFAASQTNNQAQQLAGSQLQGSQSIHLGDSLIEMVINLKNENQNLVRALEANNEYVKERLNEFKRAQEEAKKREAQFAMEKEEHEHQARKLTRQNTVLSERLKSMESKLKDLKLEVSESLVAAHSSQASSLRGGQQQPMYPNLPESESFEPNAPATLTANANELTTIQMDATSGELYNQNDSSDSSSSEDDDNPDVLSASEAARVGEMSKDELSKRFDAEKDEFYAIEDPMKQCDRLEQQLNSMGKRDMDICLLQQQLNIYRQDYQLKRMANLEAKLRIEKLRLRICQLTSEKVQEKDKWAPASANTNPKVKWSSRHTRATDAYIGRLGKKAARSAAKAARYASKQAHVEEKQAAKAAARAAYAAGASTADIEASTTAAPGTSSAPAQPSAPGEHQSHHGRHRHHHRRAHLQVPASLRAVKNEVVSDLMSTANKAMLTGYKLASTGVNLAIDKLSQYEQQQADNLARAARPSPGARYHPPSAPMEPPSMD